MTALKLAVSLIAGAVLIAADVDASGPSGRWWERAAAIRRISLKPNRAGETLSLDPVKLGEQLDRMKQQGFDVLEIFAPPEGGFSYAGLDAKDRYRIDPEVGTMEDFRRLVRTAHAKGMAILSFDNLGYSSVEAPHFLKACDDIREGRDTPETRWFLWSDRADAPPPGTGDTYFMIRPKLPGYDAVKHELWVYSERAKRYYWSKWGGVDSAGNKIRLPQYNWASREWQEEAGKVVRFWMDTGIDGMVIDAVNWYPGYTWEIGKKRITDVIASYGEKFSQPEGAGGFHEDPVAWVTEGGWNCIQDYGLGIWWEKETEVLRKAIEAGDPRPIEPALRDYHDRVVREGAVLYFEPPTFDDRARHYLAVATLAGIGDLMFFDHRSAPKELDAPLTGILRLKTEHPALHQLGTRRRMPVRSSDKHYAFLKTAADGSERVLVVLNFQVVPQTVEIDLSGLGNSVLTNLETGESRNRTAWFQVALPAYGYAFFKVEVPAR
ncbi:MAG TPA: alpha-amylase family glycosyl hydrolase [Bryobacteraceae bacterium]|nr:alpha-amylase family glycosyl hydrolase [Bryobacteraceae bacterium]